MMKKTYQAPSTEVVTIDVMSQLLTVSTPDKDINYGGVDIEGVLDPASRINKGVWEEE